MKKRLKLLSLLILLSGCSDISNNSVGSSVWTLDDRGCWQAVWTIKNMSTNETISSYSYTPLEDDKPICPAFRPVR